MESLARYLATTTSQRWPMPLHILSQYMTPISTIQMSHQISQQRPTTFRSCQMTVPRRAPRCQVSRLQDPKPTALRHTLHLKTLKTAMMSLSNPHLSRLSLIVHIVGRRELLGHCSTNTSKLILNHTGVVIKAVLSAKPHNGISTVIKTRTGRYVDTSALFMDVHTTFMAFKVASRDDWTMQKDISRQHMTTVKDCQY